MEEARRDHEGDPSFWAPGTITLEDCEVYLNNSMIRACANASTISQYNEDVTKSSYIPSRRRIQMIL